MAQFVAMSPDVEVNGETVYAVVDGMGAFRTVAMEILSANGIEDPQAGQWYPQQKWLDAFKKISSALGANTLFAIGMKIPENAQFPPDIDSMEKGLRSIDVAYHMNHRGGDIGEYRYESAGPKSARMVCRNPYPCAFDRGIITAIAKRFKLQGNVIPSVKHDDSAPCRAKGDDCCIYTVNW
jgi:hypothetical protein